VASRIKAILEEDQPEVYDRRLRRHRRVRGDDIAILGLTHQRLKMYADELSAIGIRSRLEQDGWFSNRAVQLLYHGLSLVADPNDRHAGLYLAVTELGDDDLNTATGTLLNGNKLDLPLIDQLIELSSHSGALTVDELVNRTIDAMGLYEIVSIWPDAVQARANLLRVQAESESFVKTDREALAGGGFYGSGLKTFLAWLLAKIEDKDGDRQPTPQVHDEDAVQLFTWHAAKGMEWPIVVVTTLDRDVNGRLPSLDIEYTSFDELDAILDNARIAFSPQFAAPESNDRFQAPLDDKAREEGLNLLYVALTRPREQLILEWPEQLEGSTRYTFWHLLQESAHMHLDANLMCVGDQEFPCRVTAADKEPPSVFEHVDSPMTQSLPTIGRRALQHNDMPTQLTPEFLTPSSLHGLEVEPQVFSTSTISYGQPLTLTIPSGAERGLIVHRTLELLCQGVSDKRARAALGVSIQDSDWTALRSTAKAFMQTVSDRFQPTALHWEVPIVGSDQSGSVISGTIDLLVETDDGYWIVDHKSDEAEDRHERFLRYRPQLDGYARAISEGLGRNVTGVAIHWVGYGEISCLTTDQ
jgi:ATP-dependent exoDNAse (exonuclease V) beta subunit